jgi:hypothetical protein
MNVKPTLSNSHTSSGGDNHIQRREKQLTMTKVFKPQFKKSEKSKNAKNGSKNFDNSVKNSDLKYFTKKQSKDSMVDKIDMSKSSIFSEKSFGTTNPKMVKTGENQQISPEFGQVNLKRRETSPEPPLFVVKLAMDQKKAKKSKKLNQSKDLDLELKKISDLENELYNEIDEVDNLLR